MTTNLIKIDSSKCAIDYTHSSCSLDIIPITVTNGSICVDTLILPYSFYQVNATNNVFTYAVSSSTGSLQTVSVVLEYGTYSINEIITFLNKNIPTTLLQIKYSNNTNKVSFLLVQPIPIAPVVTPTVTPTITPITTAIVTQTVTPIVTPVIITVSMALLFSGFNSIGSALGFGVGDIYLNNSSPFIISPNQINVNPIRFIDLEINFLNPNVHSENLTIFRNLCTIPILCKPFQSIIYNPIDRKMPLNHQTINHIEIRLKDNFGQPLQLNGEHFILLLKVEHETDNIQNTLNDIRALKMELLRGD